MIRILALAAILAALSSGIAPAGDTRHVQGRGPNASAVVSVSAVYRAHGYLDVAIDLQTEDGTPACCLDAYKDFLYRLTDSQGRSIPGQTRFAIPPYTRGAMTSNGFRAPERVYLASLFNLFGLLSQGTYRLAVTIAPRDRRFQRFTIPSIQFEVNATEGSP